MKHATEAEFQFSRGIDVAPVELFCDLCQQGLALLDDEPRVFKEDLNIRSWIDLECTNHKLQFENMIDIVYVALLIWVGW